MRTEKFFITEIDWIYRESGELSVVRKPPVRTGVRGVTAMCTTCQHLWSARNFRSGFSSHLGGVTLTCPACGASENISGGKFDEDVAP